MKHDMQDVAFGHASPAPGVQTKAPGLKPALERLFAAEKKRLRSTMVQFAKDGSSITITVMEFKDPTKVSVTERWSYALPTLIRGKLVASVEEWAELELASPIVHADIAKPAK